MSLSPHVAQAPYFGAKQNKPYLQQRDPENIRATAKKLGDLTEEELLFPSEKTLGDIEESEFLNQFADDLEEVNAKNKKKPPPGIDL